jgi:putative flippase GtrA
MKRLTDLRQRHHVVVGQFVRYGLVGCLNVIIFFSIFNLLTLGHASHARTILAQVPAFLVTSVVSFFLNKRWAFKDERRHRVAHQYALFLFLTLIGLGLQLSVSAVLLVPLHQFGRLGRNAAAASAIPFVVLWNFTAYKRWTFRTTAPAPSSS